MRRMETVLSSFAFSFWTGFAVSGRMSALEGGIADLGATVALTDWPVEGAEHCFEDGGLGSCPAYVGGGVAASVNWCCGGSSTWGDTCWVQAGI